MSLFAGTETRHLQLYPYQQKCVDDVCAGFEQHRKQLIVIPTGGGKTIVFSSLAKKWAEEGSKTLILAHREELIDQAIDKIWRATGVEAEKEKASEYAGKDAQVVVASVQSLMRERRRSIWDADHFDFIVVDEAHHILADSYRGILDHFGNARVLGVTATPDRGDKKDLGKFFESLAFEISLLELINKNYLSRIKIKTVPIQIDLSGVKTVGGDYDVGELGSSLERYLHEIARAIKEHASFRKTLIFLPLIKTSLAMAEICSRMGMAAEHVDGNSPDRAEILERFANNKFDVLCNAMLLTEGFDDPSIDCVVILRPTKVRSLYSQMVGRGTRVARGKDNLLLLDFLWMHEKHELVKPASLIASTPRVVNAMQKIQDKGSEVELEELQRLAMNQIEEDIAAESDAKKQREAKLVDTIKENSTKHKKFIDAMEFSVSLHDAESMEFTPSFAWEEEKPSEKQLQFVANMGIDPGSITCKGHAKIIIDRAMLRRNQGLATPKQLNILRKFKHPQAELVTFEEAKGLLDGYFSRSKSSRPRFGN